MEEAKLKRGMYLHGRIHMVKMYIKEIKEMEKGFFPHVACTKFLRCIRRNGKSEVVIGNVPIPLNDTLYHLRLIRESYEHEILTAKKELEKL